MDDHTLPAAIMQARDLLAGVIANPDALSLTDHLDLQLAAGDLETLWHGARPPARPDPEPAFDVPNDLLRVHQILLGEIDEAPDVPTALRLAHVARQVEEILRSTTRP